jgi:hypothetical protein
MATKITLTQRVTNPIAAADRGSLLPKTSISAPGTKLASRDVAPKHRPRRPGQPHNTAATMVAIKLAFLLLIPLFSFA